MANLTPEYVYRYYETDGVPASGPHKPVKSEIWTLWNQGPGNRSADDVWLSDFMSAAKKTTMRAGGVVDVTTELAAAVAATIGTGTQRPRVLNFPAGDFTYSQPITFSEKRNITWRGQGSNSVQPSTRLTFTGTNLEGGLTLVSSINCVFEGIEFVNTQNLNSVVTIRALNQPSLSSLKIEFHRCTFRPTLNATTAVAAVFIRNCSEIYFTLCNFLGGNSLRVGANLGTEPDTYGNGNVVSTRCTGCTFFGDVVMVRGGGAVIEQCFFDWTQSAGGVFVSPTVPCRIVAGGDQVFNNLEVRGCFFASPADNLNSTAIIQGTGAVGLVAEGNWFDARLVAINLAGLGGAEIAGNRFLAASGSTTTGIVIGANAKAVAIRNSNDFSAIVNAGGQPVQDTARTTPETEGVLISKRAAANVTLSTANTYFPIISQSVKFSGRRVRLSYSVTIQGNTASTIRARIRFGATQVVETILAASVAAGPGYVVLTLAPLVIQRQFGTVVVELSASSITGTNNVALANDAGFGGCHMTVEEVD